MIGCNPIRFMLDYYLFYERSMKNIEDLLYYIAIILVILWGIGYLGYHLGDLIHVLLVLAIISILIRIIRGQRPL